jgi:hypothetical protein
MQVQDARRTGQRGASFNCREYYYAGCAALLGNEMPCGEMDGD